MVHLEEHQCLRVSEVEALPECKEASEENEQTKTQLSRNDLM